MASGFYVTLPSNSSMEYFPENTLSNFTVLLNRHLEFNEQWEVGLTELHFPLAFDIDEHGQSTKRRRRRQIKDNPKVTLDLYDRHLASGGKFKLPLKFNWDLAKQLHDE